MDEALPVPASLAEDPAQPVIAATAIDPFRSWRAGPAVEGLGRFVLEHMKMVGTLSRGGQYQALVSVDGHLYRVSEGQRLGRDEGVVVRIDAQRMEVRERLFVAGGWQQRSRYLVLGRGARGEIMDETEAGVDQGAADSVDGRQSGTGNAGQG